MNKLQMKYNGLHILFWMATCCIFGYVAVYLQYKGMSNTEIGIVTGAGCIASVVLSPLLSSLMGKIKGITIKQIVGSIFIFSCIIFMALAFLPVPKPLIMIIYILLCSLNISVVPFLSILCMNYIKEGKDLNFGLSRGFGSVAYALSALVLGQLISRFKPGILPYTFLLSSIGFLVLLFSMPNPVLSTDITENNKPKTSLLNTLIKYREFFIILVGFAFLFGAASSLGTYMINTVRRLGGDSSFFGLTIFFMAASEMPIMAITPWLLKKYDKLFLIAVGAFFYVVRNFMIALAPGLPFLLIGASFQSLSYGLITPVITYYVSENFDSSDEMMGQTMIGIMTTGLGSTLGNVVGGILQDNYGINAMYSFVIAITTIGSIIIISMVILKVLKRNKLKTN